MSKPIPIPTEVMAVLDGAEITEDRLRITQQLDRKLYTEVNKVLEAIGGKWRKSAKAHLFEGPVADILDPIMLTGEYSRTKQDFGQFDTPRDLAGRVAILADIGRDLTVLEPSAGVGSLVKSIIRAQPQKIVCIEIDQKRLAKLIEDTAISAVMSEVTVAGECADFLAVTPYRAFDRVVMNPPFANQADIHHVTHALKFLKPGGRLVAIMSTGLTFRENAVTRDFKAMLAAETKYGEIHLVEEGAFKSSGTNVRTIILRVDKA